MPLIFSRNGRFVAWNLEEDLTSTFVRLVQRRVRELDEQKAEKLEALRLIEASALEASPQRPELLDALPITTNGFEVLPEATLRKLFQAFQLVLVYDKTRNQLRCEVTIRENALDELRAFFTHAVSTPDGAVFEPAAELAPGTRIDFRFIGAV